MNEGERAKEGQREGSRGSEEGAEWELEEGEQNYWFTEGANFSRFL